MVDFKVGDRVCIAPDPDMSPRYINQPGTVIEEGPYDDTVVRIKFDFNNAIHSVRKIKLALANGPW